MLEQEFVIKEVVFLLGTRSVHSKPKSDFGEETDLTRSIVGVLLVWFTGFPKEIVNRNYEIYYVFRKTFVRDLKDLCDRNFGFVTGS